MEYPRDTEMSIVHITPDLNLSVEESWLGALTILEQVITQVIKRVSEKSTPPEHEFVHTLEADSEMEFEQLPPTLDMSPIIWYKIPSMESIPHFPVSENKLSVVLDKTQDIILELLINSMEIYLAWQQSSQNKENCMSKLEQKLGKQSKGNKLKASYKG